jgi:hypothetical protein
VTPFGLPVLPEVKKMTAGSDGDGVGSPTSLRALLEQGLEARVPVALGAVANDPERQAARQLARSNVRVALGVGQQDCGLADLERMIDLRRHVAVVERGGDEAGLHTGEVVDHERIAVGHQRGDPVALAYAEIEQTGRIAVARPVQLAPGPLAFRRDQCHLVRLGLEASAQNIAKIDRLIERWSRQRHDALPDAPLVSEWSCGILAGGGSASQP